MAMRLTVVGCGDAFGSGGRFNTCFLVETGGATIAIDFGATSLVALKRLGIDPNRIDAIVLSHLHGDHFGGLPFLLLDLQFSSNRERPLTIVGPVGAAERIVAAQEVFFPQSSTNEWRFPLSVVDLPVDQPHQLLGAELRTFEVVHGSGAPATAVRLAADARVLTYSGDTSWTEALVAAADGADLLVMECYRASGAPANHLDLETIDGNRARLRARRILLTHFSPEMLGRLAEVETKGYLAAHDGLVLEV